MNNNIKINIAISAHKRFLYKTYETCVSSLIKSGIKPSNIYIFIGDDNIPSSNKKDSYFENTYNVNLIYLKNNYFEINCFLGILENQMDNCDYWFVMHDTCVVGNNFAERLHNYKYENKPYVALWKGGTAENGGGCGSIGAYKFETIKKYEHLFYELYQYENSDQNNIKRICIIKEDIIFRYGRPWKDFESVDFYYDVDKNVEPRVNIFGTQRRKETCPYLELSKFKANYNGFQPVYILWND
jgi:hypothetical protein